jgi:hypothetical protein
MATLLEAEMLTVLQAMFESLNAIAPSLPAEQRAKVEDQAKRIARAKSAIMADTMR